AEGGGRVARGGRAGDRLARGTGGGSRGLGRAPTAGAGRAPDRARAVRAEPERPRAGTRLGRGRSRATAPPKWRRGRAASYVGLISAGAPCSCRDAGTSTEPSSRWKFSS